MTVGNKTTSFPVSVPIYYGYYRIPPTPNVSESQGSFTLPETTSRVWNGGDRPKVTPLRPKPRGKRREYTLPIKVTDSRGRVREVLVKKHFYERPSPTREEKRLKNVPHGYTVTFIKVHDEKCRRTYARGVHPAGRWYTDDTAQRNSAWPNWYDSVRGISLLPTFSANDQLALVLKLQKKIQGSDFNLAVTLGEGRETMQMITNTAYKLAMAGMMARKGRFREAADHLTDARGKPTRGRTRDASANSWLELQYGWLPLLGDVKAGAEQLAHIMNVPTVKRYQVRIAKPAVRLPKWNAYQWYWHKAEASVSRSLTAYVSSTPSTLGITGLMDPELVAWELLPFSFVADWVLPIGDYLQARAFAGKLTGTFVTSTLTKQSCRGLAGQYDDYPCTMSGNTISRDQTDLVRTVSTTLFVPTPTVKSVSEVLSWKHMANAIALVSQVFKGSGPSKALDRKISNSRAKAMSQWKDIVVKAEGRFLRQSDYLKP